MSTLPKLVPQAADPPQGPSTTASRGAAPAAARQQALHAVEQPQPLAVPTAASPTSEPALQTQCVRMPHPAAQASQPAHMHMPAMQRMHGSETVAAAVAMTAKALPALSTETASSSMTDAQSAIQQQLPPGAAAAHAQQTVQHNLSTSVKQHLLHGNAGVQRQTKAVPAQQH
jgi:hypothetical protein